MKKIVAKNQIIIEILMQFLFYLYNDVMPSDDIHELTTQIVGRTVFYSQNLLFCTDAHPTPFYLKPDKLQIWKCFIKTAN